MAQVINLGSSQAPYWEYTKELQPNEIWKLDYVTDSFHLLSTSEDGAIRVSFGGSMIETPFSAGMGYKLTEPVQFIQLQNITNDVVKVKFAVGIGNIRDDRLTVSGSVFVTTNAGETVEIRQAGFANYIAKSGTGGTSLDYVANTQIDVLCTNGTITLNNAAGITALVLNAGQSWSACLGVAGTLSITGTGSWNLSAGSW